MPPGTDGLLDFLSAKQTVGASRRHGNRRTGFLGVQLFNLRSTITSLFPWRDRRVGRPFPEELRRWISAGPVYEDPGDVERELGLGPLGKHGGA
jgi:hypothetical protein